ncbi:MAG: M3 family metallopeptidase [Bacillus sp. (in: Bacteria)]|nr:M3 family metallopeptidase [Bacillus sp. (in: firmicutes)]
MDLNATINFTNVTTETDWKKQYELFILKMEKLYQERAIHQIDYLLTGKPSEQLPEISKALHEHLTNKKVKESLEYWKSKLTDPLWKRRLSVMLHAMEMELLKSNPTVTEKTTPLERKLMGKIYDVGNKQLNAGEVQATLMESPDRELRRQVFSAANAYGGEVEEELRSLIKTRNKLAQENGYPNFYEYCFHAKGLRVEEFIKEMDELLERCTDATAYWEEKIKTTFGWEEIHFYDMMYLALNFHQTDPALFSSDKLKPALNNMLESVGIQPEEFPMEMNLESIPFGGCCISISPNELNIIINKREALSAFLTGAHEVGHAIDNHYTSYEYPEFFRFKSIIGAECMSELFQTVYSDEDFLRTNFNVNDKIIAHIKEGEHLLNLFMVKFNYFMARLEHAMYTKPDEDYQRLSNSLYKEIFGYDGEGPHPAREQIFTALPVYVQDYLYALGVRDMIRHHFQITSMYGQKDVFDKVKTHFMKPGERYTWKERAKNLCGEGFTFDYLGRTVGKLPN